MGGLHYQLREWDGALWTLAGSYGLLLVCSILAALAAGLLLYALDAGELAGALPMLVQLFVSYIAPLLSIAWVGRRIRAEVSIDAQGMTIKRHTGSRHLLWAACSGVRRDGRQVYVWVGEGWHRLPSPSAYTDAAWLEALILDNINARRGDAVAPPAEVAAALQALAQR